MSNIFLLYKLTITSACNMFDLHWLIGLISPKKYWRVAKDSAPILKGVIQVKFHFDIILMKIETTEERFNFLKTSKARFREKCILKVNSIFAL